MQNLLNRSVGMVSSSRIALTACLIWVGASGQALAQTPAKTTESSTLETPDIIVTATRQNLASQRVPLALTAVGSQQLRTEAITAPSQLGQLAPGLYVLNGTSEGFPRFTLRGLALTNPLPSASPTVATYIDDVYQNYQRGITTTLYDLQRVEVLRGPQGTTFGRNTTGGAVAYYSQQPTNRFEGYVTGRLAGGDQPQKFLEGMINVPLVNDTLALRVSGHIEQKGNFAYDTAAGKRVGHSDNESGRVQLKWTPDDKTTVNLIVSALRRRGEAPLVRGFFPEPGYANALGPKFGPNALPVAGDPDSVNRPVGEDNRDNFDNQAVTLRLDREMGDFTLTSITHYRHTSSSSGYELSGVAFPSVIQPPFFPPIFFDTTGRAAQYGEELRIASDPTKRLSGVFGGYYEHDRINLRQNYVNYIQSIPFSYNEDFYERLRTTTYAAFASVTFKVTDTLALVGGARKTYERRTDDVTPYYFVDGNYQWTADNFRITGAPPIAPTPAIGPYSLQQKTKPWTWDATVNFTPTHSTLFYARVSKGFRSGGFNPPPLYAQSAGAPFFVPAAQAQPVPTRPLPQYAPESVKSYEAGFKLGFMNNRLRINAAGYHYDYRNQQVTAYLGAQLVNQNAAKSVVNGGELEVAASLTPHFDVRGSVAYTDAHYADFPTIVPAGGISIPVNYKGNTLQQAPKWTINAGANYSHPLTDSYNAVFNGTLSYRSRIYFDNANDPYLSSEGQTYINLRLGAEHSKGKGLSAYVFVNNLLNNKPMASGYTFIPGAYYNAFYETGRLAGVDVSYRF